MEVKTLVISPPTFHVWRRGSPGNEALRLESSNHGVRTLALVVGNGLEYRCFPKLRNLPCARLRAPYGLESRTHFRRYTRNLCASERGVSACLRGTSQLLRDGDVEHLCPLRQPVFDGLGVGLDVRWDQCGNLVIDALGLEHKIHSGRSLFVAQRADLSVLLHKFLPCLTELLAQILGKSGVVGPVSY